MNKIFNWTIGSFFRTIGRIIAIGLISILFYSILSKSGFKISDYLSFEKVYAAESLSWTTQQSRIYYDQQGTENQTSWQTIPYTQSLSYPATQMQFRLQYSGGLKAGNTYKFKVSYLPSPDSLNASGIWFSDGTNTLTQVNCSGWARESNNYYANICAISPEVDISSSGYLYVRVVFNESYVNSVRSWVGNFDETKGTGAIIQDSAIDIINNQNDNTQSIIQNQIQQFTSLIESQKVCSIINNTSVTSSYGYLDINGNFVNTGTNDPWGVTDFLQIDTNTDIIPISLFQYGSYCFYNINKSLISCYSNSSLFLGQKVNIPNNSSFIRFSIKRNNNAPQFNVCRNGSQGTTDAINDLNNSINDSNVSGGQSAATDLFNNFTNDSHGLTAVVQAPLNFIQSLTSSTCSVVHIPLPFMENQYLDLPCLLPIYQEHFGSFLTLYQLILSGIIGYRIAISVFFIVKDLKNPDSDRIEVLDL